MNPSDPDSVHRARFDIALYLSRHAPQIWSKMMQAGIEFILPPAVRDHWTIDEAARFMAERERERLLDADLYHLDATATARSRTVDPTPRDVATLVPATSGLVVWADPIATSSGIPVIAALWGPMTRGSRSTWVTWWTDTLATTMSMRQDEALALLSINGMLTYDREAHLPPLIWPEQVDNAEAPEHDFYTGLFGTWEAIGSGVLGAPERVPAPASLAARLAHEGLPARMTNAYGRALPGAA